MNTSTHTVLASVPMEGTLYTVVAEVAWHTHDPVFRHTEDKDEWVCRLLEVRYRLEGSEVWNTLPEWAEPKWSTRQAIEDEITKAMDRGIGIGYEELGTFHRGLLKGSGYTIPESIDYLITANA